MKTKAKEESEKRSSDRKKAKAAEIAAEKKKAEELEVAQRETTTTYGPRKLSPNEQRILLQVPSIGLIDPLSQWTHPVLASLSGYGLGEWTRRFGSQTRAMSRQRTPRDDSITNPFQIKYQDPRFFDIFKNEGTTREWWTMVPIDDIKNGEYSLAMLSNYSRQFDKHWQSIVAEFDWNQIPKDRVPGWIVESPFKIDQSEIELPTPNMKMYMWMQRVNWGGFLIADWVTAIIDLLRQPEKGKAQLQLPSQAHSQAQGSSTSQQSKGKQRVELEPRDPADLTQEEFDPFARPKVMFQQDQPASEQERLFPASYYGQRESSLLGDAEEGPQATDDPHSAPPWADIKKLLRKLPGLLEPDPGKMWEQGLTWEEFRQVLERPKPAPAPAIPAVQPQPFDPRVEEYVDRVQSLVKKKGLTWKKAVCAVIDAETEEKIQEIWNPSKRVREKSSTPPSDNQGTSETQHKDKRGKGASASHGKGSGGKK